MRSPDAATVAGSNAAEGDLVAPMVVFTTLSAVADGVLAIVLALAPVPDGHRAAAGRAR